MLKPTQVTDTSTTQRLIKLWAARYAPDLSILPTEKGVFPTSQMVECASTEGRVKTVDRVRRLLKLNCERAGLETNSLLSYIPNIVNLAEARRLAQCVEQVYERMLAIYLRQPPPSRYLYFIDSSSRLFSKLAASSLTLPAITQLAEELEPIILKLQSQHLASSSQKAIGFITTQFHFSTKEVLKQISPCEQVLLTPYLKFVEEQVCIPWQRVCAAAAQYEPHSPIVLLIEQLLSVGQEIATTVYQRAAQMYPTYHSRRGNLTDAGVAASTTRDLAMFQGYLWLCVLEGSMTAIEQELLPLCWTVFPNVEVSWELVERMIHLLVLEIQAQISPEQQPILQPYLKALQQIFVLSSSRSAAAITTINSRLPFF